MRAFVGYYVFKNEHCIYMRVTRYWNHKPRIAPNAFQFTTVDLFSLN